MTAPLRMPCASGFYRGDTEGQLGAFLADFTPVDRPTHPVAGVVPHAGWFYSGRVAARIFRNLAERRALGDGEGVTVVLFGAVHSGYVRRASVFPGGAWRTPLGDVAVDRTLAEVVVAESGGLVSASTDAHAGEHSIEVQVPMIRHILPRARILPVATPPSSEAPEVGEAVGRVAKAWDGGAVLVVGTTDLTHYGPDYGFAPAGTGPAAEAWMRENDRRIIGRAIALDARGALAEAAANRNACGAGALAATIAAARAMGADEGVLVDYTTSHDVRPESAFTMAVGYAGFLFGTS